MVRIFHLGRATSSAAGRSRNSERQSLSALKRRLRACKASLPPLLYRTGVCGRSGVISGLLRQSLGMIVISIFGLFRITIHNTLCRESRSEKQHRGTTEQERQNNKQTPKEKRLRSIIYTYLPGQRCAFASIKLKRHLNDGGRIATLLTPEASQVLTKVLIEVVGSSGVWNEHSECAVC
jgi:hypothetical protein